MRTGVARPRCVPGGGPPHRPDNCSNPVRVCRFRRTRWCHVTNVPGSFTAGGLKRRRRPALNSRKWRLSARRSALGVEGAGGAPATPEPAIASAVSTRAEAGSVARRGSERDRRDDARVQRTAAGDVRSRHGPGPLSDPAGSGAAGSTTQLTHRADWTTSNRRLSMILKINQLSMGNGRPRRGPETGHERTSGLFSARRRSDGPQIGPADGRRGHTVTARGDIAAPDIPPGGNGSLRLRLPLEPPYLVLLLRRLNPPDGPADLRQVVTSPSARRCSHNCAGMVRAMSMAFSRT